MRLYLDSCCYCRQFDDEQQDRIALEIAAVNRIMSKVDSGAVDLIVSDALLFELRRIPDGIRRDLCLTMVEAASRHVRSSESIRAEARRLVSMGFKELDAAHLAFAAAARVDFFLTTDDRLLRKTRSLGDPTVPLVVNPATWIMEGDRQRRKDEGDSE